MEYKELEDRAVKLKKELSGLRDREKEIWEELDRIWENQRQITYAEKGMDVIIHEELK